MIPWYILAALCFVCALLVSFTLETVTMVGRSLLLLGAVFP